MVLFSRFFIRKRIASVAMTSFALADDPASTDHFRRTMPIQYVADWPNHSEEQPFLSENDAAMNKIEAERTITPTGDVDKELVAMIVPHHQRAVDVAKDELKYGHSEQLRRLAREIVATERKEIRVMRDPVSEGPSSAPHSASIKGSVTRAGMQISQ